MFVWNMNEGEDTVFLALGEEITVERKRAAHTGVWAGQYLEWCGSDHSTDTSDAGLHPVTTPPSL